jgi:predicted metalloprotease
LYLERRNKQQARPVMRWDDFRRSGNVEDRRGLPMGPIARGGGLGLGTIVILGLIAWGLGVDPRLLIGGAELISSKPSTMRSISCCEVTPTCFRNFRSDMLKRSSSISNLQQRYMDFANS